MEQRKFAVGQSVTMTLNPLRRPSTDTFEVVRLLPPEGGNPQYRIKSLRDGHERVVTESEIV